MARNLLKSKEHGMNNITLNRNKKPLKLRNAVLLTIGIMLLLPAITDWCTGSIISSEWAEANSAILNSFYGGVTFVLVGPVAEEYVFRKNIYGKMREALPYNKSMIISSIIWGCLHGSLGLGINAFFMGLVYAAVYERCHTLKWPIALHMIINCLAVLPAVSNHVNTVYVFFMSNFFAKVPIVFVVTEIYVCCILMKKIFQGLSKSDNTLWENETGERM